MRLYPIPLEIGGRYVKLRSTTVSAIVHQDAAILENSHAEARR
jgi:hypothetical protein